MYASHLLQFNNAITSRLTAAKESGESIVVDGKKVALGIPGGGSVGPNSRLPNIPLGRAATPDEAAKAVLL